jgi:glycosyltransferase involved in cell wall biosynthesis
MTSIRSSDYKPPTANDLVDVSVVMAVYNGRTQIERTVKTILNQTLTSFELIIVDDGSSDGTDTLLQRLAAADSRVNVVRQKNTGLTRALLNGCNLAQGRYIARQDVGDISRPDRLAEQMNYLDQHSEVVLCCSIVELIGPHGELLGIHKFPEDVEEATRVWLENGSSPNHSSTMFRTDVYRRVGGYRAEFRTTQDHDLWYRLMEHGKLGCVQKRLVQYVVDGTGISAQHSSIQVRLSRIARDCYACRIRGESEEEYLKRAEEISAAPCSTVGARRRRAEFNYFVGSTLLVQCDWRCRRYFLTTIRIEPWNLKVWLKLLVAFLRCWR